MSAADCDLIVALLFDHLNPTEALKYGVIGLAFLLAFLVYRLIGRGQNGPIIYVYMLFFLVLCFFGISTDYFKNIFQC